MATAIGVFPMPKKRDGLNRNRDINATPPSWLKTEEIDKMNTDSDLINQFKE